MSLEERLKPSLELLYGARANDCLEQILERARKIAPSLPVRHGPLWSQRDTVLIAYADHVNEEGVSPLVCLGRFLASVGFDRLLSTIHLLPFFPFSSDDGFSVMDYRQVAPDLGNWNDIRLLGEDYNLMFDLVLNHVSRHGEWFAKYLADREPYTGYFIEVDPEEADLTGVTRPRSHPLLTPVETSRGICHLWTTFSTDQIDLNFANPDVLVEMVDILLFYIQQGARIIRLDAIAYLWKRLGTPCIHLPETHTIVKLLRDLVDEVAPGTILLTETNVPHEENISYLGDGDEAQMIYQFSLAPLLLEALLSGDATLLVRWLSELAPLPPGTTVFNFTASHDGIGVRPLEGLMPETRFERLLEAVRRRGGRVSMKRNPDGTESPYELNITYFSALMDPDDTEPAMAIRRFLASQAIMLALQGIPGIYFSSLVGTPNDLEGVARTGRARSINRQKFELAELETSLGSAESIHFQVLESYRRLLEARVTQPAFHPEAAQEVVPLDHPALLGFLRASLDGTQKILVLSNLGLTPLEVPLDDQTGLRPRIDLLDPTTEFHTDTTLPLAPYQVAWLVVK